MSEKNYVIDRRLSKFRDYATKKAQLINLIVFGKQTEIPDAAKLLSKLETVRVWSHLIDCLFEKPNMSTIDIEAHCNIFVKSVSIALGKAPADCLLECTKGELEGLTTIYNDLLRKSRELYQDTVEGSIKEAEEKCKSLTRTPSLLIQVQVTNSETAKVFLDDFLEKIIASGAKVSIIKRTEV